MVNMLFNNNNVTIPLHLRKEKKSSLQKIIASREIENNANRSVNYTSHLCNLKIKRLLLC